MKTWKLTTKMVECGEEESREKVELFVTNI
jgi:hypothetical protein